MNLKNVVKIPYNNKPAERRATSATVTILPVISIIRFPAPSPMLPSKRLRGLRNIQKLLAE
jgi:hypothetical protein